MPEGALAKAGTPVSRQTRGDVLIGLFMIRFLVCRAVLALTASATPALLAASARAESSCADIARNYALDRNEATSIETNAALFAAAENGCDALAEQLLDDPQASLLARNHSGAMPLAVAAREGRLKLVELFLARGAPINARDLAGSTALLEAARHEKRATVSLLLARGADPNLAGRADVTPLIAAAFAGNERIVEELLAHRADPNARDATGKGAMVYAAARGFDAIVQRLLDAGVDARARYGNDLTAVMWAAGHDDGVGAAAVARVLDLLTAHGAALDDADNRGRTALMIAAELGDADTVALLLARGADRARRDRAGKTALDLAKNDAVRAKLAAP